MKAFFIHEAFKAQKMDTLIKASRHLKKPNTLTSNKKLSIKCLVVCLCIY